MKKSKYKDLVEDKLNILKEEMKKTDNAINKYKKSLTDLQILKYKIEGGIFTLNQILDKE